MLISVFLIWVELALFEGPSFLHLLNHPGLKQQPGAAPFEPAPPFEIRGVPNISAMRKMPMPALSRARHGCVPCPRAHPGPSLSPGTWARCRCVTRARREGPRLWLCAGPRWPRSRCSEPGKGALRGTGWPRLRDRGEHLGPGKGNKGGLGRKGEGLRSRGRAGPSCLSAFFCRTDPSTLATSDQLGCEGGGR